jgi:hypothetical protein
MARPTFGIARRGCAVIGFALVVGLAAAGCDHRAQPMVRSVPVALASAPDPKALEAAIEVSLAHRHWTIKEHQPGRYVVEYNEKGHSATAAVLYDGTSARIDYVDSQGLLYEKGSDGEVIHRSYNLWVKNLASDIKINLSQGQLSAASTPK